MQLPLLPVIVEWELIQSSITSPGGIESQRHVCRIKLHRCSRLVLIDAGAGLSGGKLEQLSFERCRKIKGSDVPGQLAPVKTINLQYGPDLHSLELLTGHQQLEGFDCFGTKFPAGDVTLLLPLPKLSFVEMSDARHFSHTTEQLTALLAANNT
jgi:hypothetical protein